MTRELVATSIVAALMFSGCVSKKDMEAVQAELATCREQTAEAEARVQAWQERFDRENEFWQDLQAEVGEAVPNALAEIHEQREQIIAAVPEQVRGELELYLDDYFATVMQGFDTLQRDNDDIQLQLEATQKALEVIGSGMGDINEHIDTTVADERSRRDRVAKALSNLVGLVVDFDQTRINCRDCGERLRLNRKERETILAFHANLMNEIANLERMARSTGTDEAEAEADPDASEG